MSGNAQPERTPENADEIIRDYVEATEENPEQDRRSWIEKHPDVAQPLETFFGDHDAIETVAAPLRDAVNVPSVDRTVTWDGPPRYAPDEPMLDFGDYQGLTVIGRGAMGVVYQARQVSLNRIVALKMILAGGHASKEQKDDFENEARDLATVRHANIVQVHQFGQHEGKPYIVLEYLDGGSLKDRLTGAPWEARDAAHLLDTLARANHTAHQAGIVHRDLKPGNILFAGDGTPKINDFGLALRLADAGDASSAILGTPAYMAPEQARGKTKETSAAADVYALGAILYELLTGRAPFTAATAFDIVMQVVSADPVPPRLLNPRVDRDLETICMVCLRKEPQRRYPSALALAEDLRRFLDNEPITARPIGRVERTWRWCKKHPSRAAAVGIAVIALLTVLTTFYVFNRQLRREHGELQKALTRQVAERHDKQLQELAALPQTIAAGLALRQDWSEEQLEAWMRQLLEKDRRGYGITVAFEPAHKDFALYVYRDTKDERLKAKQLTLEVYKPHYSQWVWYKPPVRAGRPVWSEPFEDVGGANDWIVTYSVPFFHEGKVRGVVTIDLQRDFFAKLRSGLDKTEGDLKGYGFLVSKEGVFLSHPNEAWSMPRKLTETEGFSGAEFAPLREAARQQKGGSLRAVDPHTGRQSTFLFAPVSAAEWLFVVVIEE